MMDPIITVGFVGSGNLASNIAHNLPPQYSIEQVISRSPQKAADFAAKFSVPIFGTALADLHPDLDILILAVPDFSIAPLAGELATKAGGSTIFLHCSGTTPITALAPLGARTGVLWPMQTLTRSHLTSLKGVPLFIEAQGAVREQVRQLAFGLSDKVVYLNSEERLRMHCGAVIAGNFSTFMLEMADRITQDLPGVSPAIFEPLIRQSLDNAMATSPREAMTGPARRNDQQTIQNHLQLLHGSHPELETLYQMISEQIQKMYENPEQSETDKP